MDTENRQVEQLVRLNSWRAVLLGAICAVVGLAPWLIAGPELPVQNLWLSGSTPDPAPWALLPLGQYEILRILALLYFGGLFAGMVTRLVTSRGWVVSSLGVTAGLLAVQLAAFFQSLTQVLRGIALDRGLAQFYVLGLSLLVLLCLALSIGGFRLLVRVSRAATGPALCLGAMLFVPWIGSLIRLGNVPPLVSGWVSWSTVITIILLSVALVFVASKSGRWTLSWGISLVGIWIFMILLGSLQAVTGSRAILSQGPERILRAAIDAAALNGYYSLTGLMIVGAALLLACLGLLALRSFASGGRIFISKDNESEISD